PPARGLSSSRLGSAERLSLRGRATWREWTEVVGDPPRRRPARQAASSGRQATPSRPARVGSASPFLRLHAEQATTGARARSDAVFAKTSPPRLYACVNSTAPFTSSTTNPSSAGRR